MKEQNKPRFCRKQRAPLVLLAVIVIIATIGGLYAKYVQDIGDSENVVRAREFYFSSDFLKVGGVDYILNPGTDSFTIELRNHDDQLRYSEADITCRITVDNGARIDGLSGTVVSELEGGKISDKQIQLSNLQEGVTYTVTALGEAGYEKTLSATFTVKSQNKEAYKHLEMDTSGAFVLLTVWTEDVSGDVKLSIPAGLIPDETDSALTGIENYDGTYKAASNQIVGKLNAYSSHTYRFFLETPFATYSANQFTVTVGGKTATEKIPN